MQKIQTLIDKAKAILNHNFTGEFTKPAPSLYPHQWNWDAGFIAIGYAHFDTQRALDELNILFKGQWRTGMLPQIVFRKEPNAKYFPGADFWQSNLSPNAPKDTATSGITMPPVHGFALHRIMELAENMEAIKPQIQNLYNKVYRLHEYLYNYRDPNQEGLPYIRHPWASGTDNSPTWDGIINRIDFDNLEISNYERQDLNSENVNFRPTKRDYDFYVHLLDIYKKHRYDDKAIEEECPFLVQDPLFIGILNQSNECLIKIGNYLKEDVSQLESWLKQTKKSMNEKLWDENRGVYNSYDLRNNEIIPTYTSSALMPIFGNISTKRQAAKIVETLKSERFSGTSENPARWCSTYDLTRSDLNPQKYWRGPIWINMNWLLYNGLKQYGYLVEAEQVKNDALHYLENYGFIEYFNPFKKQEGRVGYGTDNFSWSAALCIDFLNE
jgi:hypothetical protein